MKLPRKTVQKDKAKKKSSRDKQYLKHRQEQMKKRKVRIVIKKSGKERVSWRREFSTYLMCQRGEDQNFKASLKFANWVTGDLQQREMDGKEN